MTWVRTTVNDTIHIQIQMIKLRQKGRVRDDLIDLGITFGEPSVKLYMCVCVWMLHQVRQGKEHELRT